MVKVYTGHNLMTTDNLMHNTEVTTEQYYEEFIASEVFNFFVSDVNPR